MYNWINTPTLSKTGLLRLAATQCSATECVVCWVRVCFSAAPNSSGITTCTVFHLAQRGLFPQIQSETGQCGDFNYELWCDWLSLTWSKSTSKAVHQVQVRVQHTVSELWVECLRRVLKGKAKKGKEEPPSFSDAPLWSSSFVHQSVLVCAIPGRQQDRSAVAICVNSGWLSGPFILHTNARGPLCNVL